MYGTLAYEMEVRVPASMAWGIYGSLRLISITVPEFFRKIDVIEGDGGPGTFLKVFFLPGSLFYSWEEEIVKVDDEKMVKATNVHKGGYLDLGFNLFQVRFEVIKKTETSCITRTTIVFDIKDGFEPNASYVSILGFMDIMQAVTKYLEKTGHRCEDS
ncbi:hypothetical protein RJ639_007779 [Escallonia herrerae]|uniref:Bet v I/Major latex protein domain-containing protein n=1 Tax=Escallonia herrerae TaxID=1293975 RepID=A0AA88VUV5_9ASTE|nr:hypothetical protein RJ639_007779 [Escallonia herrerae]